MRDISCCVVCCVCVCFFQAEDGIRYLVRSRGLGDVYKRQPTCGADMCASYSSFGMSSHGEFMNDCVLVKIVMPVSYTHLTLPTSDLV